MLSFLGTVSLNGRLCQCVLQKNANELYTIHIMPTEPIAAFSCQDDEPPTDDEVASAEIYCYEYCPCLRILKVLPMVQDG